MNSFDKKVKSIKLGKTVTFDITTPDSSIEEAGRGSNQSKIFGEIIATLNLFTSLDRANIFRSVTLENREETKNVKDKYFEMYQHDRNNEREYPRWVSAIKAAVKHKERIFKLITSSIENDYLMDPGSIDVSIRWTGASQASGKSGSRGDVQITFKSMSESELLKTWEISLKAVEKNIAVGYSDPATLFQWVSTGSTDGAPKTPTKLKDVLKYIEDGRKLTKGVFKEYYDKLDEFYRSLTPHFDAIEKDMEDNSTRASAKSISKIFGKHKKDKFQREVGKALGIGLSRFFKNKEYRNNFLVQRLGATLSGSNEPVVKLAIAAYMEHKRDGNPFKPKIHLTDSLNPSEPMYELISKFLDGRDIEIKTRSSSANVFVEVDGKEVLYFDHKPLSIPSVVYQPIFKSSNWIKN